MSSSMDSDGGSGSGDGDTINGETQESGQTIEVDTGDGGTERGRISELLHEAPKAAPIPQQITRNGGDKRYRFTEVDGSENGSMDGIPGRAQSPSDSAMSIPDDSPSVQGSVFSSPGGSSILPSMASRPGLESPTPSFRPFDRRFQSRLSSSVLTIPRAASPTPAYLKGHGRQASINSQILDSGDTETPTPPWEVIRWTKLKKMNGQAFSEVGKRSFGMPTCISVSASIVLGTSKGVILIFDYHQNLKSIIGPGTKAVESGAISSIAISADHLIVAGGHANGSIFTWEIAKAARPFLHVPSLQPAQMVNRTLDGHIPNAAIRHLGFLGVRHTAVVSADDRGMAFSHLATRGMGAVGRSVRTTRILGRYPNDVSTTGKPRKPSTVLAFSPLPLGNVERGTDTLGLTAMLTPYLLVIVSTTPIAQTQHKAARPKEVVAHSAMSGCLAWFPAVKLKVNDPKTGSDVSKVKLVYCWSNVLTVLDVDEITSPDKDKPPSLSFKPRSRWKAEEAIVAVQWLSRSVLTVLTITQRLIVLEDETMRTTEAFDLVQKHIYHQDLFSEQLHNLVEQLDEDDLSMHGVVADAFYMSFKAYKGRMFLLGFNDVSIGSLSNWADRLISLMEDGDYIGAIQLATSYYTGDADKLTIGLPEDTALRHQMVQDKLVEIMTASLKFAFGQHQKQAAGGDEKNLKDLAEACFAACLSIGDIDFLFDEAYEWYEDGESEGIFLETLEPHILETKIITVPPTVVKAMVSHYVTKGLESRLEEMVCHMETVTIDVDQVTTLCKQHHLYDALIYVWNQALGDYVTPLIDLLTLLVPSIQNGEYFSDGNAMEDPIFGVNALKMFPYMSYVFTGRVYPTGDAFDDQDAMNAKAELYWFIFSGRTIAWPKSTGTPFLTQPKQEHEPSFPYLRMILKFDAPSFLSALNEAFEDSFLNDTPERAVNGGSNRDMSEEHIFGLSVNRQYIVTILLEVMNPNDFALEDTIYLDMFIARNLPKFPQYLLLSGTALHKVLTGLCNYPGDDLADDAQLSVEYLLSVYHPPHIASLLPLFEKAGFYRVLKSTYKADKQYNRLIQTYFDDPNDQQDVFDCIADCLRTRSGLTKRQIRDVHEVMEAHANDLVRLDAIRTAQINEIHAPSLHGPFLDSLPIGSELQYTYLHTILEPEANISDSTKPLPHNVFTERYAQLMCKYNSAHVADYVGLVQASDLRLESVLPFMEDSGVIDGAVVLMARDGQMQEAMDRLIKHLRQLEATLLGILGGSDEDMQSIPAAEAAQDLLDALQKYTNVGIWLCCGKEKAHVQSILSPVRRTHPPMNELLPDETLWLDLIDVTVQTTRKVSTSLLDLVDSTATELKSEKLTHQLRTLVQRCFTALLKSTSSPTRSGASLSFLRILRAFLTRASISSPNLSDLRAVLASIFSAYAYEESILSLANRLLEKDLFVNVKSATSLRQRGWRPRGSTCEGCGRRVWGPGVSGDIFSQWEEQQEMEDKRRKDRAAELASGGLGERGKGRAAHSRNTSKSSPIEANKGKGKGAGLEDGPPAERQPDTVDLGSLVVLACRHIYHQSCLGAVQVEDASLVVDGREFRCPIDG
ncbi:Golgi CORVET complex core vacuolar protein 8-domain-containing protein [Amylocarpus encephaloides]|uniref:Golgi CORVET complex core vacuolar protein 8-domain-containing protein n=1 Tax=Amylocarpus encephaloides TaxID=45428 RepID=A0A9P7Y9E1_9HELO|nr:Golgi CORVET complex core vacuolar protein 8-domain-containing protein [Amylocarpus encephaloides]